MHATVATNAVLMKRIIALLLAFAGLAQRMARAPRPIRFAMLAILRRAEPVARDFLIWEAWDAGLTLRLPEPAALCGNDPDDALWLAACFRWIAMMLTNLSDLAPVRDPMQSPARVRLVAPALSAGSHFVNLVPVQLHDTS